MKVNISISDIYIYIYTDLIHGKTIFMRNQKNEIIMFCTSMDRCIHLYELEPLISPSHPNSPNRPNNPSLQLETVFDIFGLEPGSESVFCLALGMSVNVNVNSPNSPNDYQISTSNSNNSCKISQVYIDNELLTKPCLVRWLSRVIYISGGLLSINIHIHIYIYISF